MLTGHVDSLFVSCFFSVGLLFLFAIGVLRALCVFWVLILCLLAEIFALPVVWLLILFIVSLVE